jgi:hypothetical protein
MGASMSGRSNLLSDLFKEVRGLIADAIWHRMFRYSGELRSSRLLPSRLKTSFAYRYAIQERAEIALTVAGMYPGGDYFEFGSEGFTTFRNFLTAFDLNGLTSKLPNTKFFAFDVFGDLDSGKGMPDNERWYFEQYRGGAHLKAGISSSIAASDTHYRDAEWRLRRHNLLLDRCEMVKGYFEDTLNEEFKARLRREKRNIGFAFLDCNISSSYRTCFRFLEDFLRTDRAFVYMDEYFLTLDVHKMFDDLCLKLHKSHGMTARYVRNAGAFGALFCLMNEGASECQAKEWENTAREVR